MIGFKRFLLSFLLQPEIHALARGLAADIDSTKPIVFALAVKEPSAKTLKGLKSLVSRYCKF